mmetsp:Transcript_117203/g.239769  ORF Transcript_117203/g.239769 Transcript_117203/m.239769 type:complete len:218 (-) Transcript_117203:1087-1740(-)
MPKASLRHRVLGGCRWFFRLVGVLVLGRGSLGLPPERPLDPLAVLPVPNLPFLELLHQLVESDVHQLHLCQPGRLRHRPQHPHGGFVGDLRALHQGPAGDFLGRVDQGHVPLRHQAHGPAAASRPGRPSDPVDVRHGVPWQLGLDDQIDGGDVESPAGNVGGDQDPDLLGLELAEGGQPPVLREERVEGDVRHADLAQYFRHQRAALAGRHKDDGRA